MTKLLELQKAVANRNFEHDAIDEDLEFVEDQFDAFRKYFNAVYEDICAGEAAKVLLSSGRWTTEQYQDKIVSLDQNRRMAHDRATVADYVGNVMQEYYQEGLSKQREKDKQTFLDTAFDNVKKAEKNPAEAYKRKRLRRSSEEELEI